MKKRYNSSSSDSDDDVPLIKRKQDFRKNDLYKWNIERCEFCDAVFYNKYNIMVHNATHIIIPLLKQNVLECPKCYFHFTSATSLQEHMLMKHLNITNKKNFMPDLIQNIIKSEPYTILTKEEFVGAHDIAGGDERDNILESLVMKQPVTVLTKENFLLGNDVEEDLSLRNDVKEKVFTDNNLLESIVSNEARTLLIPLDVKEGIIYISDSESSIADSKVSNSIEDAHSMADYNFIEDTNSTDSSSQIHRIKDRILFEDDNDDILNLNIPNDLNIGYKSNVENSVSDVKNNTIILGKYPCEETKFESVHYEELIKPGVFACKKCQRTFNNRYHLILHETNHIRFCKRLSALCTMCDWYLPRNRLRAHQFAKHPGVTAPPDNLRRCRRCNLPYKYFNRHMRNYHNIFVCKGRGCVFSFNNEEDYNAHECTRRKIRKDDSTGYLWHLKTRKVCDLCLSFFKDTASRQYKCIGSASEAGVRMKCDRCFKEFFELNIVNSEAKLPGRMPEKNRITNEERLKNIQQRIKKMNMLNKF